jgi:hypothetical protein
MKTALQLSGAIILALIGAVAGAMLTTNYSNMRTNGASYVPALQAGVRGLGQALISVLTSPWLLVPLGLIALVTLTVALTLRATKPKADPLKMLGYRMSKFVDAAHHDQRFREFRTLYNDTMRICREMEAFMIEVRMQGLPTPSPQSEHAEDWIDLACDYFTAVGPYLRNGNQAHATAVAQDFANRYL